MELTMDEKLSEIILSMYSGKLVLRNEHEAYVRFENAHSATSWSSASELLDGACSFASVESFDRPCLVHVVLG